MTEIVASIVVPFFNGSQTLPDCIQALNNQTLSAESLEFIFVDDGSTEPSDEVFSKYPHFQLIHQRNQGPAAARNTGVRHSKGPVVLFTDSDCAPKADWAEKLIQCLEEPQVSGAKGTYLTDQKQFTPRFVQIEYQQKYRFMRRFEWIDFIDTYSAGFRKEVFANDFYDESFPKASVEDQEFSFRLAKKGFRFRFCPEAIVKHRHVETIRGYFRKKRKIGFWKAKILFSQLDRFKGDSHTPFSLKFQLVITPLMILAWIACVCGFPLGGILAGGMTLAFLLSNASLFYEALIQDSPVTLWVPFFTLVRALGLGMGLLQGLIYFGFRQLTKQPQQI